MEPSDGDHMLLHRSIDDRLTKLERQNEDYFKNEIWQLNANNALKDEVELLKGTLKNQESLIQQLLDNQRFDKEAITPPAAG